MNWLNAFGFLIVALLIIPNMVYFYRDKNKPMVNKCRNKVILTAEQIGRYGTMALMIFPLGIGEFSLPSDESFAIYLMINVVLLLLYWIAWYFYMRSNHAVLAIILAVIPSIIFVLNGVLLSHGLLILFGVIFAVSHIYITYQNTEGK